MVFLFFGLMATCRDGVRDGGARAGGGVVVRRRPRAPRGGDPRREQPAGHPDRRGDAGSGRWRCVWATGERACCTVRASWARSRTIVDRRAATSSMSGSRASRSGGCSGSSAWIPAIRPMEAVGVASGRELIRVLTGTAAVHAATRSPAGARAGPRRTVDPSDVDGMEPADISLACAAALVDGLVDGGVGARIAVAGVPFDAPRARPRARSPRAGARPPRRAIRAPSSRSALAKATGAPGDRGVHERHRGGRAPPRASSRHRSRGCRSSLLTADRPPRLRGTGANQTIVQPGLFGEYVRRSFDLPVPVDRRAGGVVAPGGPRGDRGDGRRPAGPGAPELPVRGAAHPVRTGRRPCARTRSGSKAATPGGGASTPTRPIGWPSSSPAHAARSWSADWPGAALRDRRTFWSETAGLADPRRTDLGRPSTRRPPSRPARP